MNKNVHISVSMGAGLGDYVEATKEIIRRLGMTLLWWNPGESINDAIRQLLTQADIFVGIYARRYGHIPEMDLEGKPNVQRLSYVEMEYHLACELGVPRLLFFLDPDVEWPLNDDEFGLQQMAAFRQKILADMVITPFTSIDNFRIELAIGLARFVAPAAGAMMVRPVFEAPSSDRIFRSDIFMVMPFAAAFLPIYTEHIVPIANSLNLKIKRGDDFFSQHEIMHEIWSAICGANFVIADCTGKNANVFYELGLAHTLGKHTILITQNIQDIPFDVRGKRVIVYEYTPHGMKQFEEQLKDAIMKVLDKPT